jgi:hypothetical protein
MGRGEAGTTLELLLDALVPESLRAVRQLERKGVVA